MGRGRGELYTGRNKEGGGRVPVEFKCLDGLTGLPS